MNFRTQKLANRFPLWTKIRNDPSAFGQRFMDSFADGLELNFTTAQMLLEEFDLTKRRIGYSFLYEIVLEENDMLTPIANSNGYVWSYPTVIGKVGINEYILERGAVLSDILQGIPTRLSLAYTLESGNRTLWTSETPYDYEVFSYPERLWIKINDSSFYTHKTEHNDRDKSGLSRVTISGFDIDYNAISDSIDIFDDGMYVSNFAFREINSVTLEGFDGLTTVSAGPVDPLYEIDPYRTLVFDDFDGPLHLVLESNTTSFLSYETDRLKLGRLYRRPGVEVSDNSETLATLLLLDSEENSYEAVSMAISPENSYLYVVDNSGYVHIYEHTLPDFLPPVTEESLNTYVEITPVRSFAKYGETEPLWTRFSRVRYPISWIKIYRINPEGVTEHLQSDKTTWGPTEAKIQYVVSGKQSVSQWQDFKFDTTYDQLGMWEYVCVVKTNVDITTYVTGVMCGGLIAKASLDSGVDNPALIYFSDNGYLTIDDGTNAYFINQHVDKYLIDERAGRLWLSDNYDSVSVETA